MGVGPYPKHFTDWWLGSIHFSEHTFESEVCKYIYHIWDPGKKYYLFGRQKMVLWNFFKSRFGHIWVDKV